MISYPVGQMISSLIEASYQCSLRFIGSTSHLINEQGNGVRDHSITIDDIKMYGAAMVQQNGRQDVWCSNGAAEWTARCMVQQWDNNATRCCNDTTMGQQRQLGVVWCSIWYNNETTMVNGI